MKTTKILSFLTLLATLSILINGCNPSVEGCNDPNAENYNPEANSNNGTCLYATIYEADGEGNIVVTDLGKGTGTMIWTKENIYILDGFVFVNSGQVLTIEAGTVIKGKLGQGSDASAMVVARGGKMIANGTEEEPIIFTSEQDDVTDPADIFAGTRGLWGGLIVLGNATLNSSPGETQIEGIPVTETRGLYGGSDDTDNSGTYTYISIRYGGTEIGAGNEINGMTLGGVGNGTTVSNIEVIYNADDGFEFFGGTVNTKNLMAIFCGDDCFDYDEGFRGKGQFWFGFQDSEVGDRAGEHDGGTDPEDGNPYAHPIISNATYIGSGNGAGSRIITFRDNAGGEYHNSIFTEFSKGIDIELLATGESSYKRFQTEQIKLNNNIFWNVNDDLATGMLSISIGSGVSTADQDNAEADLDESFGTHGNFIEDAGLVISWSPEGILNPLPTSGTALSGAIIPADPFFEDVNYIGAFGSTNWAKNWTFLNELGYFE